MDKQQGAAALLVVSVLLVAALMMSLGSYKSLFYQIKRANNQIEARQEHWRAEGGLECGYAINKADMSVTPNTQDYSSCLQSTVTATQSLVDPKFYELSSSVNNRVETFKSIEVIGRPTGAIQARSDLKLMGSYLFTPEFVEPDTCVSVRFMTSVAMEGAFVTTHPSGKTCSSSHMTNTERSGLCVSGDSNCDDSGGINDYKVKVIGDNQDYIGDEKMFEHDFVHDPNLDPFEAFFGSPRSQLDQVKNGFVVIDGSVASSSSTVQSCVDRIISALSASDKVWVVGDCDLETGIGISLNASPKLLVIEDGLLSVNGADSFPGTVYQLFTSTVGDMTARWTSDVSVTPFIGGLSSDEIKKLTFFSRGAFKPVGGYVFDTPGGLSVFGAAVNLEFDSTSVPNDHKKIKWKKGSWNDL
ncbi:hypothetical protein [Vibrio sp. B181a]|uniref:hypothetical protein n=1 Tax=Vibrio sp. B181a TaxID=2835906 RepID=UPI0025564A7E|nr:hypothetical protein [Vibrio sp. B181a]MDK9774124.1 hypothetical protein [Vibrio sp. B181a]